MKLLRTVIGSYPPLWKNDNEEEIKNAIKIAVEDQLAANIDLISDGQVRYDMVQYFTRRLEGFEVRGKESFIIGKVKPTDDDLLVKDFKFVKSLVETRAKIKGIITGPVTLVFSSKLDKNAPYSGFKDETLYLDVAEALKNEALKLQQAGVDAIQIDEPFYSIGAPMDLAKKAVETITSDLKVPVALHACGKITRVFDNLLDFEGVDILSHEFAASPENFDVVTKEKLEDHGKKLGVGCVKANDPRVESIDFVVSILENAIKRVGIENIIVHPDCGLRILTREIAFNKLKVMDTGVKKIEEKYSS